MSFSYTEAFTDIGLSVRVYNLYAAWQALLDAESVKRMAQLDDDGDDADLLKQGLAADLAAKSALAGRMSAELTVLENYLTGILAPAIDSTAQSAEAVIDDLVTKMTADSETVDACAFSMLPGEIADANDGNSQIDGYSGLTGIDSGAVTDVNACAYRLYLSTVDDGGGDWHINIYSDSARTALVAHSATYSASGSTVISEDNSSGIGGTLTVSNATGFAADTDIYVEFAFGGSRAGTGTIESWSADSLAPDADYRARCISITTTGSEVWQLFRRVAGGEVEELSARATTGTAYSADGVNFTITAPAVVVENDGSNQLASLSLTGAVKSTNCDADGRVWIDLAGKEDAITEANDGNDQVAGYDGITGLVCGTNTDSAGILYVTVVDDGGGDFHVNLYNDSARGAGDLVAHTASYSSAGEKALVADNASGLGGTIDVDDSTGFAADADITVTFPFVQVSVYKESGKSNLVAQSAWTLGTGNAAPSGTAFTLTAQNSSGLSGTVTVSYTADDGDIAAIPIINFAVGDEFRWSTTTDDAGTFEAFFRDVWGKALPSNAAGAETIADSLAE